MRGGGGYETAHSCFRGDGRRQRCLETRERSTESRLTCNVRFVQADARLLPFDDTSFDAVLFSFSFHHLPAEDHAIAIQESLRVMKNGGLLMFLEPGFCGSLVTFERVFHAGDGDEQIAIIDAYFSMLQSLKAHEIAEICAERIIQFDDLNEVASILNPTAGKRTELIRFLEQNDYTLCASRRMNVFQKRI